MVTYQDAEKLKYALKKFVRQQVRDCIEKGVNRDLSPISEEEQQLVGVLVEVLHVH